MSHSYPIWNEINSCIYKSDKSYGAKDTSDVVVKVGTSGTNSMEFVRHATTRSEKGQFTVFKFGVDTGRGLKILKTMWMHTKTHKWYERMPAELREKASFNPKRGAGVPK